MGPGDFPTIIAVMLAVFASWLFIDTFRHPGKIAEEGSSGETKSIKNPKARRDIITGFGLFTVMLVMTPFMGFSLASSVFVCLFLLLVGRYKFYLVILIAVFIPSLLWFIFAYLLTVPLPKGPWGF